MRAFARCDVRSTVVASCLLVAALVAPARAAAQELTEEGRMRIARRLAVSTVSVDTGRGSGSGFVAGDERWIVTNFHVVERIVTGHPPGTARARVDFGSGTTLQARVIETDPDHDLALLEVEVGHVPARPLELADSDLVTVGQTVLAFGSPHGLAGTLTEGVVSARRELPMRHGPLARRLIQTDAAIGPGSSGGPLVDRRCRVVGVNTASYHGAGGIHLAVPANYVRDLLARVRAARAALSSLRAPNLGPSRAAPSSVAPTTALTSGLVVVGADPTPGVVVQRVVPGSAADRAGIRGAADRPPPRVERERLRWSGHVVVAVDGHPITTLAELDGYLASCAAGQSVRLTVRLGTDPSAPTGETTMVVEPPR